MASVAVSINAWLIVLGLENLTGIMTNLFILSVILFIFCKDGNISTSDKILIPLCISNISYSSITSVNLVTWIYWTKFNAGVKNIYVISSLNLFSFTSSFWFTACLCSFYFFKIIHFRCRFLAWIKVKIDAIVPWLILVSVVVSFSSSFSSMLPYITRPSNVPLNVSSNAIKPVESTTMNIAFIAMAFPIFIGIVTTCCTIRYLKLHSCRMKMNAGPFGGSKLKAHQTATNTMIRLLVFYKVMYLELIIFFFEFFPKYSLGHWMTLLMLSSFTSVQSVLLILGNPRLREVMEKTARFLTRSGFSKMIRK